MKGYIFDLQSIWRSRPCGAGPEELEPEPLDYNAKASNGKGKYPVNLFIRALL